MKEAMPGEDVIRDRILQLLVEGEVDGASVVATAVRLANGDEYLDLEQLQQGVQRARGAVNPLSGVLPRKAIHEDTWRRILRQLKAAT